MMKLLIVVLLVISLPAY
ncbi:type I toxin-antitoxin system Ibs family toxin [Escherichia coli]